MCLSLAYLHKRVVYSCMGTIVHMYIMLILYNCAIAFNPFRAVVISLHPNILLKAYTHRPIFRTRDWFC